MATRSPHFCCHSGCSTLTTDTYCTKHTPMHDRRNDSRDSAADRGYDTKWRKARDRYLRLHPLCEQCELHGKIRIANMVHHIKPIDEGGPRLDPRNFMALCRDCHEILHGRKRDR